MQCLLLFELMDDIYDIVNSAPNEVKYDESVEDAHIQLIRRASMDGNVQDMEALARTLVIENARRRHAEAKYNRAVLELEALKENSANEF